MRRIAVQLAVITVAALASSSALAQAQQSIVTHIGYVFPSISRMSMSEGGQGLTLRRSGSGQTYVATATTSYAIATNEANRKIVAQLDREMPAGVMLSARLAAPSGGTSTGVIALSPVGTDVVTGISSVTAIDLPIRYTITAPGASLLPSARRTVVYTIIAGM